jgi:maltose alpha-D-glucosyltransferase/alpha-amylase
MVTNVILQKGKIYQQVKTRHFIVILCVNVIWLLPFYPSPLRDDGYDIAAYMGIHRSYGTCVKF